MAEASDVSYGTWEHADSPYRIRYSLPVFREIEFYVSEGFRRIPYGGIEHGGLLFGKHTDNSIQIEAFRPIECEHASGPSFLLSENDIGGIRRQLAAFTEDTELAVLAPVGMFVSHSRRDLRVSTEEEALLRSIFPEPWQCLLVVKPEKFKPAQFGFVFRHVSVIGGTNLEGATFFLPLPARSERKPRAQPASAVPREPAADITPSPRPKRTRRTAAKLESATQDIPAVESLSPPAKKQPGPRLDTIPVASPVPPPAPAPAVNHRLPVIAILLSLLPLAACFAWFYWNYLQPPIEVHAAAQPGSIVVSWPAQTTAAASRAHLRVWANHHEQVIALSPAQRSTGRATVAVSSPDVTIELVASYRLHNRRGMVRVISNP